MSLTVELPDGRRRTKNRMNEKLTRLWETKNKDDEWWSSFFASPLAILLNYVVVDVRWITPNLITRFSLLTALVAAVLIVVGGWMNFCVAAALINVSLILDCMDGQLAKYRGSCSRFGNYFDKVTDQIALVPSDNGHVGNTALLKKFHGSLYERLPMHFDHTLRFFPNDSVDSRPDACSHDDCFHCAFLS